MASRLLKPGRLLGLAMLVALGLWFAQLRPAYLGGPANYIMVSGISMEPTMYTGDLALVKTQDAYMVGDIVAYSVEDGIVIHRIIGGTAEAGFIMRGDNNDNIDPWRPQPESIVGQAWIYIPWMGRLVSALQSPAVMGVAVGGLFLYLSLAGMLLSGKTGSRGRRDRLRARVLQRRRPAWRLV